MNTPAPGWLHFTRKLTISATVVAPKAAHAATVKKAKRPRNALSLKEAVVKATTGKPLTKEEVCAAVKKLGYVFTTDKPLASIKVVLYGRDPKFKNQAGKFSPA